MENGKAPFSDKIQTPGNITLLEGDEPVFQDEKVAEILNDYFVNITAGLEASELEQNLTKTNRSCDPVDIAIDKYNSHPNIQLIRQM